MKQTIRHHSPDACAGQFCVIHNPSDHHMREWDVFWRDDVGLMERICEHGVGHPDPDDIAHKKRRGFTVAGVHGCDGCCRPPEVPLIRM